jgi:hypothetical protein
MISLLLQAHRFLLFLIQKPCRFNLVRKEEQANATDDDSNQELDDEEPSPGSESISISHSLNGICEQPTKGTGYALGEIGCHYTLSCQFAGVDGREQKGEALGETGLGGIQQHANGDSLTVGVDKGSTKR